MDETLLYIPIEQININPMQPRKHFNEDELAELAASIRSVGIIQPPIVQSIAGSDRYELIAGERRVRASKLAGLTILPVLLMPMNAKRSAEWALIENIQRADLNPIEIAEAIHKLMAEFKLNQEEAAKKIGKKRSTIANYLRLLSLRKDIQESLSTGLITMGHAKAILSLTSSEKQTLLFEAVLKKNLSVRETESHARKINLEQSTGTPTQQSRNFPMEDLREKLQQCLGTKVSIIEHGNNSGQIRIDYYNLDDLERLLNLFLPPDL